MLNRVTYSHALRAPKPWPSSPLSVTAAAISTPSTLRTKTMSSVVLNADLVSVVLRPGLVSVVLRPELGSVGGRGGSAAARYVGVFVVESVVVIGGTSNLIEMRWAIKPFPRPGRIGSPHRQGGRCVATGVRFLVFTA